MMLRGELLLDGLEILAIGNAIRRRVEICLQKCRRARRVDESRGRGREKSSERKSARVGDISITALYIRCSIMFCRRMSVMIAIRGFSATMYVKF